MARKYRLASLARDCIKELNKANDKEILGVFIKQLVRYANESPIDYEIPIIKTQKDIQAEESKELKKQEAESHNKGFRFTENCVISNKCSKRCFNYKECKEDYLRKKAEASVKEQYEEIINEEDDYIKDESEIYEDDE